MACEWPSELAAGNVAEKGDTDRFQRDHNGVMHVHVMHAWNEGELQQRARFAFGEMVSLIPLPTALCMYWSQNQSLGTDFGRLIWRASHVL